VIDLRVLRPLDTPRSWPRCARRRRAVVVDEGWRSGSLAAEIMARIVEQAFYDLDAPVARVCSEEVPMPYAKHLEEAALPQPPKIVAQANESRPITARLLMAVLQLKAVALALRIFPEMNGFSATARSSRPRPRTSAWRSRCDRAA
jgi:hypothetical protein